MSVIVWFFVGVLVGAALEHFFSSIVRNWDQVKAVWRASIKLHETLTNVFTLTNPSNTKPGSEGRKCNTVSCGQACAYQWRCHDCGAENDCDTPHCWNCGR